MNEPTPLYSTMPDVRWAHRTTYGNYPWTDRTVAPWECRQCRDEGIRNVF